MYLNKNIIMIYIKEWYIFYILSLSIKNKVILDNFNHFKKTLKVKNIPKLIKLSDKQTLTKITK